MDLNCPGSSDSLKNEDAQGHQQQQQHQQQQEKVGCGIQLRTSARVSKKLRLDQEALAAANDCKKDDKREEEIKEDVAEEKPRARRAPVLWSPDDKAAFFEALNEHGKNFDAIEKYMLSRAKKRGDHSAKNRDRARHFYYRTWHKISKHVHFPESVKKVTQELYALINFGELRKKVGYVTEKNAQKFNELIYSGCTQVRVRGKAWRVKTPVCRALRKLNQFEDDCEEVRLPSRVEVLITPRSNRDSAHVQALAHNPRVRTTLSLDTTVDSLREFLQSRWWSGKEVLKIGPKKEALPVQASYKCGQVVTSSSVSLLAHEQRLGGNDAYEHLKALLSQLQIGKTKSMLKWQRDGPHTDPRLNSDVVDPNGLDEQPVASEGSVTRTRIGQLYITYGSKGVLELEYWWEQAGDEESEFAKALQKLVSIAKLYHLKIKVECPCGHICKNNVKPTTNIQAKASKQIRAAKSAKPEQRENKVLCFKQPLLPAPSNSTQNVSKGAPDGFAALQFFRSKYCNRRGRSRQRSVVVQRMLPLLPKTTLPLVVTLQTMQPNPTKTYTPPIVINPNPGEEPGQFQMVQQSVAPGLIGSTQPFQPVAEVTPPVQKDTDVSPVSEAPADINTPGTSNTFKGILSGGDQNEAILDNVEMFDVSAPTSPSLLLKDEEGQWLNSEVADFSLSSFLGHLESPLKSNGLAGTEDTHMSTDVDSHFQSLMAESSLDYTAKFADLAAKIVGNSAVQNLPSDPP
ncbi:uncharacterized protein LOC106670881 isoform X2 [Cimex lectularius]|uniref:Protein cramped n=1 Tax=Cimex lectularius TaxID=79782 RepID=A0A8I6S756_CIMLE|nr:uncharacterized protein LOC106670881 isoform X2 [Cimex lectularius]